MAPLLLRLTFSLKDVCKELCCTIFCYLRDPTKYPLILRNIHYISKYPLNFVQIYVQIGDIYKSPLFEQISSIWTNLPYLDKSPLFGQISSIQTNLLYSEGNLSEQRHQPNLRPQPNLRVEKAQKGQVSCTLASGPKIDLFPNFQNKMPQCI